MGSSKEMEKLWIHGALNVCVNDQSEITVELEGGGGRKKRGGGEKNTDVEKNQGGRRELVIYSGLRSPSHCHQPSILWPHKGHSSH